MHILSHLAGLEHDRILDAIVRAAVRVVPAEAAGLYLLDEAANELVFEVILGGGGEQLETTRIKVGQGIPGYVVQTGQPMIVENDPRTLQVSSYKPRHVLCVPMMLEGQKIVGALALYNSAEEARFEPHHMEHLAAFAEVAAIATRQSELIKALPRLAGGDEDRPVEAPIARLANALNDLNHLGDAEREFVAKFVEIVESYVARVRSGHEVD